MFRKMQSGFTLIELLIVIAVIAILAALLLPALAMAKRKALIVCCIGNMKQIGGATHLYLADNDETFPYVKDISAMTTKQKEHGFFGKKGVGSSGLADLELWEKPLNDELDVTEETADNGVHVCPTSDGKALRLKGSTYMAAARRELDGDLDLKDGLRAQVLGRVGLPSVQIIAGSWIGFHFGKYGWSKPAYTPRDDLHREWRYPYVFVDGHAIFHKTSPGEGFTWDSDTIDWGRNDTK